MSVTNCTINIYESARLNLGRGVIKFHTDTFKALLTTSTYVPSSSGHTVLADITNELSGSGYSRQTLAGVTWVQAGAVLTFDCNNPVWTASGGNLTARYYVIYDDTPTSPADPLLFWGLLDDSPADVIVTDGNTFSLVIDAAGLAELA